jgi:hypothetical protein
MHYELKEKHDFDTFDSMSIEGDFSQYRKVIVSIKSGNTVKTLIRVVKYAKTYGLHVVINNQRYLKTAFNSYCA